MVNLSLYNNLPFIFRWTIRPVARKSIMKVPNQVTRRWRCLSFFSFFFFRRANSKLWDSYTVVFMQNSILHWAVHKPIAFSQLKSLTRCFKPVTQELYGFICDDIFVTCTHACNHLVAKHNYNYIYIYYPRLLN